MKLQEFDYELPKELIAQRPLEPRDSCRLLVVRRESREIIHDYFYNLPKYLKPDDLVVFNNTRVFPARLYGQKDTGGRVEVLLLRRLNYESGIMNNVSIWKFVGRNIGRAKRVRFDTNLVGEIVRPGVIKFNVDSDRLTEIIGRIGHIPLPPYVTPEGQGERPNLARSYNTIYAREKGSAAAPTAGFHFTKELLEKISNKAFVTLHVGQGTFAPVKTEKIEDHKMHYEYFEISQETRNKIQKAKRIIAVGTTSVRVLESDWSKNETNIFIYPGYKFKYADAMVTNFHLPKSTLLMLVSAFVGKDLIMKAYQEAIKLKYRFYSFGDAMLII